MRLTTAVGRGLRHAAGAPGLVVLLWLLNLGFALPAGVMLTGAIHRSVSDSLVADELVQGFDYGWFGEFEYLAEGMQATFRPSLIGVGALLDNLESLLGGDLFFEAPGLTALGLLFALTWTFLLGGILGRLRQPRDGTTAGLVATGARTFRRFLTLAVLGAALYYGIYRLARWLFPTLKAMTRDVTSETTVLSVYLLGAAAIALLLGLLRLTLDFGRASIVIDNRRSALVAWARGARFVLGRPMATIGLLIVFATLGALVIWVYSWVAPGASPASWPAVVGAFLIGQAALGLRLWLKLALYGTELELYASSSP